VGGQDGGRKGAEGRDNRKMKMEQESGLIDLEDFSSVLAVLGAVAVRFAVVACIIKQWQEDYDVSHLFQDDWRRKGPRQRSPTVGNRTPTKRACLPTTTSGGNISPLLFILPMQIASTTVDRVIALV
jgi:hypothetical protein